MAKGETFDSMLAAWIETEDAAEEVNEEMTEEAENTAEDEVEEVEEAETEEEEDTDDGKEETEEEETLKEEESESESTSADEEESEPESNADEEDNKAKESSDRESKIRLSMQADVEAYNTLYPNEKIERIEDIPNALDFARMRRGGLSVEEAARYVRGSMKRDKSNGKEHIKSASSVKAASSGIEGMSKEEYATLRDMFPDMPKKELESLYKRTRSK